MTKQEFLTELEQALCKLPRAEVEQALAFYDEAISDRMEDGLSETEAVADLGPIDAIAAQITDETPPIPRAIARANTGSRTLNIVLLVVFSPIWVPIALGLAAAALAVYVAIWAVILALWATDAAVVLMPIAGLVSLASLGMEGSIPSGIFVLGITLIASGIGLLASFGVFWASRLLFRATRSFARWIASLFVRVSGQEPAHRDARPHDGATAGASDHAGHAPVDPRLNSDRIPIDPRPDAGTAPTDPRVSARANNGSPTSEEGAHHA